MRHLGGGPYIGPTTGGIILLAIFGILVVGMFLGVTSR